MFLCSFIGAAWAAIYNAQTAPKPELRVLPDFPKPDAALTIVKSEPLPSETFEKPTTNCVVRDPNAAISAGGTPSCPPWMYYDHEARKLSGNTIWPSTMKTPPDCVKRPYNAPEPRGDKPTCGPWLKYSGQYSNKDVDQSTPPCPPGTGAWTSLDTDHPCELTAQQRVTITDEWQKMYEADLSARRQGIVMAGLLGFVLGMAAGIIAWILYRGARFAITG
jgi:hypothetical protein